MSQARSGQMLDRLIHRDEDAIFVHGQSEEKGVSDLLMAEDALVEGRA
jgi:hypothetical protein